MTTWVCTKCGFEVKAEQQPALCPCCYAPTHHMSPKKETEPADEDAKKD